MNHYNIKNNVSRENNISGSDANAMGQRSAVEDITNRLDQMNVDMVDLMEVQNESQDISAPHHHHHHQHQHQHQHQQGSNRIMNRVSIDQEDEDYYNTCSALMEQDESIALNQLKNSQIQSQDNQNSSNILIVTNLDVNVFKELSMQTQFEALFLAFDSDVTFRYLKSFRRVRLDFTDSIRAERARSSLNQYMLGTTRFKCYAAQIIKPNYLRNSNEDYTNYSAHLNIPKLTKQFLISPPASPPVGWRPVEESSPCIDVQLISAIANLVPGKMHEIHAGNESQPGIYVEVCEEPKFENPTLRSCSRIPKTMSPAYCQSSN